uniref:Non-reducing end alpha-L-arabinofuranosidase n=1 Tax=Panagrolaimus superbus TaxID=310955 RepID=A0A914XX77_9BILA
MKLFLCDFILISILISPIFADRQYKVAAKRISDSPIISRKIGSDFYSNLYAGIYQYNNEYGLIVGTWNDTGYYLVNSKLFYFSNGSISALPTLNNATLTFPQGTTNYNSGGNNFDSISFFNGSYYLLYDETDLDEYPVLAWAKTDTPFDQNSWIRLGHIFPDSAKINTFKASFLWATKENALPMHYLFWDDTQAICK